jgi:thiol-disulfide isomerase/thioredoxin
MRATIFAILVPFLLAGCRPSAAPVAISEKPVSINDVQQTNVPLPPSKPLAEMNWSFENDRVQTLGSLAGKAVILDFWATYCEPCKQEIPHLNTLAQKYGDQLEVVGLNVGGEEDRPKIPNFIEQTKMAYPFGFPEDELTRFVFSENSAIPQTLVFDRSGKIVKKFVGFNPRIASEIDAAVELALASR